MRLSLGAVGFALLAALPACGTGGISPPAQPLHPGNPWFERRAAVGSQGYTPGNFTYSYGVVGPWYSCFVVVDVNLDGDLDLVLVTQDAGNYYMPTGWVYRGNGAGGFFQAGYPAIDMWTRRSWAATGDFDEDGWPDLVTSDSKYPGVQVSSYYGGDYGGSFWAWNPPEVLLQPPGKIVAGDWDEDGHVDAACLIPSLPFVLLLPGNGDGTFGDPFTGLPFPLVAGADPQDLIAIDLDGDGHLDLATANRADDSVSVFLGDGNGSFHALPPVLTPGGPRALAAADLDGDGDIDLAAACFDFSFGVGGAAARRDQIDILLADGRAWALDLDSIVPLERGEQPVDLVAADFDGDGDVDLAYASRALEAVGTLNNDGRAVFTRTNPARIALLGEPKQLEAGDFDEDGRPDLAVLVPLWNHVEVLLNVAD
jgi:hypothetical protein